MRLRPRLRLKKKLETDVLDLERNLEAQAKLEEQQRAKEEQELQDTNESLSYQTSLTVTRWPMASVRGEGPACHD